MTETQTLTLREPISLTLSGPQGERTETVTALHFVRPKARHLRAMDENRGEIAQALALIAALTGQPRQVVDELGPADFRAATELVKGFFGTFPPTGGGSSAT